MANVYENTVTSIVDAVDAVYLAVQDMRSIRPGDVDWFGETVTEQDIARSLRRISEMTKAYADKFCE